MKSTQLFCEIDEFCRPLSLIGKKINWSKERRNEIVPIGWVIARWLRFWFLTINQATEPLSGSIKTMRGSTGCQRSSPLKLQAIYRASARDNCAVNSFHEKPRRNLKALLLSTQRHLACARAFHNTNPLPMKQGAVNRQPTGFMALNSTRSLMIKAKSCHSA